MHDEIHVIRVGFVSCFMCKSCQTLELHRYSLLTWNWKSLHMRVQSSLETFLEVNVARNGMAWIIMINSIWEQPTIAIFSSESCSSCFFFSSMHSCTLTCERKQRICCPFILFSFFRWFTFAKWKLQVSHIAFTEGLPVTDCTKEVTCIILFIFSSTSFLESLCSIALRLHYQYLLKQLSLCDSESKESNKFSRRLGYKICITLEISKRFQMSSIWDFCFLVAINYVKWKL